MNITEIITNVGFPIFCVIACFWYINKTQADYRNDYNNLHELHKKEVDKLSEVVANNTLVLTQLLEKMEEGDS